MKKTVQLQLNNLPLSPGIYFFKDKNGVILYIGKANKLRQRVRSYFAKSSDLSPSKQIMIPKIADIDTIVTSNESEALILESIHIKKHRPHFNVALKDDKNYNFVKIDFQYERPIVTTVRRPELDRGRSRAQYFGPYTTGANIHEHLRFLRRIFPYRKKPKDSTRFEQDLLKKRALGPVPETTEEYQAMIKGLSRVLQGHSDEVIHNLRQLMENLSANRQFEKAAAVRDQIRTLEIMQSKQKMMSVKGESQDVVSIYKEDDLAAVNVFIIRAGRLTDRLNFILEHTQDENTSSLAEAFLLQYYTEAGNVPKEIILPARVTISEEELAGIIQTSRHSGRSERPRQKIQKRDSWDPSAIRQDDDKARATKLIVPDRGKKRDLIKLGQENAKEFLMRSLVSWQKDDEHNNALHASLKELQKTLNLKNEPKRIEGYDISNIQGSMSVGSMVVFANGIPDKNEYRKFKIKTVKGSDDFASLAEVLRRRFGSTKEKKWPDPDLVLLDGGKGQLSAVIKTLFNKNDLTTCNLQLTSFQFISLAKREEEVFQGPSLKKVAISPASSAGMLLQRIRDEAHRFAQAYYHTRHAKADTKSMLDEIPGIGPKTKKQLIREFGSVAGIRRAEKNDIVKLVGKAKAERLLENL